MVIQKQPRIYFSMRSPFSWMSLRVLGENRPDILQQCELIPFYDPSPDTLDQLTSMGGEYHYVQMSKAKHLYILQDTKRLSRRLGYDMTWPVDRDARWEIPHLAWLACPKTLRSRLYGALMDHRWKFGGNICDEKTVGELLTRIGVDPVSASAHRRSEWVEQGAAELYKAYKDDVFGVPYFKAGSQRFWGLERLPWFIACVDQSGASGRFEAALHPAEVEPLHTALQSLDRDTPGGCG